MRGGPSKKKAKGGVDHEASADHAVETVHGLLKSVLEKMPSDGSQSSIDSVLAAGERWRRASVSRGAEALTSPGWWKPGPLGEGSLNGSIPNEPADQR